MDARVEVVLLPTQVPDPVPVQTEAPKINPIEGLVLTATMGNQNAAIAAISGKVYDVRLGRILMTSESGEIAELFKAE